MRNLLRSFFAGLACLTASLNYAAAQGTTAFTYQGQLHDSGTNANGAYTMMFALFDAASNGNPIGNTNTVTPTLVNGLFTVNLDFGNVFNGQLRYLDITITNGGVMQTLSPRVQVMPTPYAQFAAVAAMVTNHAILNGQIATNAVATTNIQNFAITTVLIATNAVTTINIQDGAVTNRNLSANAVNATNIASGQVVKNLNGLTDSVVLSAGANSTLFTNGNSLQFSAIVPHIQVFISGGTFVVPTNVTRIKVEMWGGGGGGGDGWNSYSGGGGGAGAYALNVFDVKPGTNITVTIGLGGNRNTNGGATSFGNLMSAGGGVHGGSAAGNPSSVLGGAGGSSTGAIVPFSGCDGQAGDTAGPGGFGGPAFRGGKGGYPGFSSGSIGGGGDIPGGGGGGGGPGYIGGAGAQGVVFVYY